MHRRHAQWCLAFAETAEPHMTSGGRKPWLDRLAAEHDNLRAALTWCLGTDGELETGLRLADALIYYWYFNGYHTEGRRWMAEYLAHPQLANYPRLRAQALYGAGKLAWTQGDIAQGCAYLAEGAELFTTVGDDTGVARCLSNLVPSLVLAGDPAAAVAAAERGIAHAALAGRRLGAGAAAESLGAGAWNGRRLLGRARSPGRRQATLPGDWRSLGHRGVPLFRGRARGDRAATMRRRRQPSRQDRPTFGKSKSASAWPGQPCATRTCVCASAIVAASARAAGREPCRGARPGAHQFRAVGAGWLLGDSRARRPSIRPPCALPLERAWCSTPRRAWVARITRWREKSANRRSDRCVRRSTPRCCALKRPLARRCRSKSRSPSGCAFSAPDSIKLLDLLVRVADLAQDLFGVLAQQG